MRFIYRRALKWLKTEQRLLTYTCSCCFFVYWLLQRVKAEQQAGELLPRQDVIHPSAPSGFLNFRAGMQGFFPPGAGVPHRQQRLYTQLIKHGRSWKGKRRQQEIQAGCLPWSGRSTRRVKSFFQPDTTSFSDIVEKFFHGEPVLKHFNVTPGLDIIKWSSGGHVGI